MYFFKCTEGTLSYLIKGLHFQFWVKLLFPLWKLLWIEANECDVMIFLYHLSRRCACPHSNQKSWGWIRFLCVTVSLFLFEKTGTLILLSPNRLRRVKRAQRVLKSCLQKRLLCLHQPYCWCKQSSYVYWFSLKCVDFSVPTAKFTHNIYY